MASSSNMIRSVLQAVCAAMLAWSPVCAAPVSHSSGSAPASAPVVGHDEKAIFGMGCFWKSQYVFSKVPGVLKTEVGYCGGKVDKPTYEKVCSHTTGHAEVVEVDYDPAKVSYHKLLEIFFSKHDPTTLNRQGPDFGDNYRSVIFCTTDKQKQEAQAYKAQLEKEHRYWSPIVTQIEAAPKFYPAEGYHQDYYSKHGMVCF